MHTKPVVFAAALAALLAIAVVRRDEAPDPYSRASLEALLGQPLSRVGQGATPSTAPFWRALLESPSVRVTPAGLTLSLGRVLSDPSAARLAADAAGELLALEASGPEGKLGVPLWRAVLDGPALQASSTERTLPLYGCRHLADADAGPALEDTYAARLALARALEEHARSENGALPLVLEGRDMPVKGGVNFEVQLVGDQQSVVVTFDGHPGMELRASRAFRPTAPNDARVRANLVAALRARATAAGLGELTIEGAEAPVASGVDLRIELYMTRVSIVAPLASGRLATHLELAPKPSCPTEPSAAPREVSGTPRGSAARQGE